MITATTSFPATVLTRYAVYVMEECLLFPRQFASLKQGATLIEDHEEDLDSAVYVAFCQMVGREPDERDDDIVQIASDGIRGFFISPNKLS